MLINKTSFYGEIEIGQINDVDVISDLNQTINQFEEEYLKNILGRETSFQFTASLATTTPLQKWLDLKNGFGKFQGLVSPSISPISYYVYFNYQRIKSSFTTGGGEAIVNKQNSTSVTNRRKQVNAWNKMVDINRTLVSEMRKGYLVYPEFYSYSQPIRYLKDFGEHQNLLTKINLSNI